MLKNKKILILGGYGFIGENLYRKLKKTNKVLRFGKTKKKNQKINLKNLKRLKYNFDVIIFCAGSGTVSLSIKKPKLDYYKNVTSIKETLKYIKFFKFKPALIFISSASVYGNSIKTGVKRPISNYGKHKILAENSVISFTKKNKIKSIILRFFSIYGPGLKKQLIWDAICKFKKRKFIFSGNGNEVRSWMFVDDAIKLIIFSYNYLSFKPLILNLSSGENISVRMVLNKLLKILKIKKKIIFNGKISKINPIYLSYENSHSKKIGLREFIKIDEGLKKYVKKKN